MAGLRFVLYVRYVHSSGIGEWFTWSGLTHPNIHLCDDELIAAAAFGNRRYDRWQIRQQDRITVFCSGFFISRSQC